MSGLALFALAECLFVGLLYVLARKKAHAS
jgi:hypothetical protein